MKQLQLNPKQIGRNQQVQVGKKTYKVGEEIKGKVDNQQVLVDLGVLVWVEVKEVESKGSSAKVTKAAK